MKMQHISITKQNICLYLILAINFLFALKYLERITEYAVLIGFFIIVIQFSIWKNKNRFKFPFNINLLNIGIICLYVVTSIVLLQKIPAEDLNVDRWSVITSFWDAYLNGDYVYFAESHQNNYPGPMPFYFIIAFPFYLIGELGFMSLCGLLCFYGLMRYINIRDYKQTAILLLLISSLFYLWEVTCRSNVFLNGLLVLFSILYFLNKPKDGNYKHLCISGILIGLALSTRNVYIIPYIIAFIYALRVKKINIKQTVFTGIIALITFTTTFIPFVIGHFEEFKTMNPFIIQSTFLIPFEYTIGFILFAIAISFLCKTKNDVYFFSGITLSAIISFYYLYHIIKEGFTETFYNSSADISYYILATPFLFYYLLLSEKKVS